MKLPDIDFARLHTELIEKFTKKFHNKLNTLDATPYHSCQHTRKNSEVMKEIIGIIQSVSDQLGVSSSPSEAQGTSVVEAVLELQGCDVRQQVQDLMKDFDRYVQ